MIVGAHAHRHTIPAMKLFLFFVFFLLLGALAGALVL